MINTKIQAFDFSSDNKDIKLKIYGVSGFLQITQTSYEGKKRDGTSFVIYPNAQIYVNRTYENMSALKDAFLHLLKQQEQSSDVLYVTEHIKSLENPLDSDLFKQLCLGSYPNVIDESSVDMKSDQAMYIPFEEFYRFKASSPPFYRNNGEYKVKTRRRNELSGIGEEFDLEKKVKEDKLVEYSNVSDVELHTKFLINKKTGNLDIHLLRVDFRAVPWNKTFFVARDIADEPFDESFDESIPF